MAEPTGPHALEAMLRGYYREPFGSEGMSAFGVVQPLPAAFESEKKLDYDTRTDNNPVYIGFAESSEKSLPPTDSSAWIIQKLTYDDSDRITRIQVARGTWTGRAALFT